MLGFGIGLGLRFEIGLGFGLVTVLGYTRGKNESLSPYIYSGVVVVVYVQFLLLKGLMSLGVMVLMLEQEYIVKCMISLGSESSIETVKWRREDRCERWH